MARYNRHSAHPRLFGYVCSPGAPITAISQMIGAAMNINVTCWRSAPSGTQMELTVIRWMKEILGYPSDAAGVLVSGGSMANFAGLAAARSAKAPGNAVRDGLSGAPRMCVYVSRESHFSVTKAAGLLGLGEANVRQIETDSGLRIDLADLAQRVAEDRAAGCLPICVVANAGTTATGAFDPIGELADFARRENLWLHVDAAYGGFAALAPSARHLFARIAEADSVALDPHKWLYGPMGCGCVLYKDPATALAAFSHDADIRPPHRIDSRRSLRLLGLRSGTEPSVARTRSVDADQVRRFGAIARSDRTEHLRARSIWKSSYTPAPISKCWRRWDSRSFASAIARPASLAISTR